MHTLLFAFLLSIIAVAVAQSSSHQIVLPISKECSADSKNLTVYGYNVAVSEVVTADCWANATSIEIFALNKMLIDVDIEKYSTCLSIIAPEWEIVLNDQMPSRHIKLIGADATKMSYNSPAKNSDALGKPGDDGLAGMPGESAGLFFGIGQRINDKPFEIHLIGGKGGNGQDGGNGIVF